MTASDRGSGAIGTTAGFAVFLLLLVAAVQVLFDLHATSMITAAGHDAARTVAGYDSSPGRCAATGAATAAFESALGRYLVRGRAALDWDCADELVVRLRIRATHPSFLPARLHGLLPLARVDRTIEARVEEPR